MYKRLRRTFLLVSTLILFLVIVLVNSGIYLATSNIIFNQTRVLTDLILDNDGQLPAQAAFDRDQEIFLALTDETLHEIRFFSVLINGEQADIIANNHTFSVRTEDGLSLAQEAAGKRSDSGTIRIQNGITLLYRVREREDGSVLVVFVDISSRISLIRLIMVYIVALWAIVLLLYVILMTHYSRRLIKPFIENDERQKRFITNASHELKTPLAVISANTEMTELTGGKSKWTDSTRRQVKKLQNLVEDLVVLTRLNEMKDIAKTPVDFSAVTKEVSEPFVSVIEGSGKAFRREIEEDLYVLGDRRSVQQIVSILMDNAAKYCDEGGEVALALKLHGKSCQLAISNTYAEGKDLDYSRFFERFYRQDESHNSEKSGFGIGLSMGKEITENLRGHLRVSWADRIITFTAELPRVAPARVQEMKAEAEKQQQTRQQQAKQQQQPKQE